MDLTGPKESHVLLNLHFQVELFGLKHNKKLLVCMGGRVNWR